MHLYPTDFKEAPSLDMPKKIHVRYVHEAPDELTSLRKKNLQFLLKCPNSPQKFKRVELNVTVQSMN